MNGYPSENASISPPAVSPMLHASPILLYPTVPSLSVDVGECHTDLGVHAVTHAMPPSGDAHTASDEEPGAARSSPSTSRRWFDSYVHGLQRWKKPLLFLWVALAAISGVGAPKLFGATSAAGAGAPGTPAWTANHVYAAHFPEAASTNTVLILVTRTVPDAWPVQESTVLTATTAGFTDQIYQACSVYHPPDMIRSVQGYFIDVRANWSAEVAREFVSADERASMIAVSYDANGDTEAFLRYMRQLTEGGLSFPPNTSAEVSSQYDVSLTGMDLLFDATVSASEHDFIMMDGIVLPVALVVLALYLRNLRMMLIPLASVVLTLLASFGVMYLVARFLMPVASFTPSIMVSIAIALSIDYSLFMLTRFREERLNLMRAAEKAMRRQVEYAADLGGVLVLDDEVLPLECSVERQNFIAVHRTLRTAGHVVLISGTTLMFTFCGLIALPMSFLQSVGVGSAVALFCCMVVNLVLTPLLLLTCPNFFGTCRLLPTCISERLSAKWRRRIEGDTNTMFQLAEARMARAKTMPMSHAAIPGDGVMIEQHRGTTDQKHQRLIPSEWQHHEGDDDHDDSDAARLRALESSFWYRSAQFTTTTKYSILVVILVLALTLPVCYFSLHLHTSSDVALIFPRHSSAFLAFEQLNLRFAPGRIDPFHVITTTDPGRTGDGAGVWTRHFFEEQRRFIDDLIHSGLIGNRSVTAISYAQSQPVSFDQAQDYFTPSHDSFDEPRAVLYRSIFRQQTSADNATTLITLVTDINPNGDEAPAWVDEVRDRLNRLNDASSASGAGYTYYLNGGATDDLDGYRKVNSLFPTLVSITVACIFLFVAVLFRSVLVPLRLLFTIGLSITWIYGLAVIVFQQGIFNFVSANLRHTNTIFWMEITMTFSILVGIGLDYDVFLFSRVHEYRLLGYTTRASIIKSVSCTGASITMAGSIMAIAFGGLIGSETMVLIQFGFLLSGAVIFDTFIVRTLLVPSMMHLFGRWNWIPGTYPPEKYSEQHFVEPPLESLFAVDGAETAADSTEGVIYVPTPLAQDTTPSFLSPTPPQPAHGIASSWPRSAHLRVASTDYQFVASPSHAQ